MIKFSCILILSYFYIFGLNGAPTQRDKEHPIWTKNLSLNIKDYLDLEGDTAILKPKAFKECQEGGGLMWIFVVTAAKNSETRNIIRETWGDMQKFNYSAFKTIHHELEGKYIEPKIPENFVPRIQVSFILGTSNDPSQQWKLLEEQSHHDDILQDTFLDTYQNLTLKSMAILKWAKLNECVRNYKFIVKVDDDAFVNIPNLAHILLGGTLPSYNDLHHNYKDKNALLAPLTEEQRKYLIMGEVRDEVIPHKFPTDRYYVPNYMFDGDVYPKYPFGYAYVLSREVIPCLIKQSYDTPLANLEDVYCTGILSKKCDYKPINHHLWTLTKLNSICQRRGIIAENLDGPRDLPGIFKDIYNTQHRCSVTVDESYHVKTNEANVKPDESNKIPEEVIEYNKLEEKPAEENQEAEVISSPEVVPAPEPEVVPSDGDSPQEKVEI